jgi:hypothetical protein
MLPPPGRQKLRTSVQRRLSGRKVGPEKGRFQLARRADDQTGAGGRGVGEYFRDPTLAGQPSTAFVTSGTAGKTQGRDRVAEAVEHFGHVDSFAANLKRLPLRTLNPTRCPGRKFKGALGQQVAGKGVDHGI